VARVEAIAGRLDELPRLAALVDAMRGDPRA
jgi:hypothetical protein